MPPRTTPPAPPGRAAALQADLEALALRELMAEWHRLNGQCFGNAMRPLSLEWIEGEGRLGFYSPEPRRIGMARSLVFQHPWGHTVEVLKHEMAHQYVFEVLRVVDETAHGRAFQHVCERLAIDAASSGLPAGVARSEEEERALERISRLLALAESPNEHEAQAAMNAAQKLMLRHNLAAIGRPSTYRFRHLGAPTGRVQEAERWLASILNEHFFVETIWISSFRPEDGKRGSLLEICGTQANLDMASYVYDFLRETAHRLWVAHQQRTGTRANKDRQKFVAGVMLGFLEKLREQARQHQREGLVWVKDGNLEGYLRQRYPRVRTVRYSSGDPSEAYEHGKEAGRSIVLHRPVSEGSSGGVRLLGSGS
jgi:hypothetical protein